ncbi:MAG: iron ABC transporter permease [Bacteroidales bacterium]|nr:iron ABC transporter permease [Bacteroidales bacterium]
MSNQKQTAQVIFISLNILLLGFVFLNLAIGSVSVPFSAFIHFFDAQLPENEIIWRHIIIESRFPQIVTAILSGAALGLAGLQMQTLFRNPLAGPSILGISSGASLGVALVTLGSGIGGIFIAQNLMGGIGIHLAAFTGAFLVLFIVLLAAKKVRNNASLLIIGIMVGYAVSSIIGLLNFVGQQGEVHAFVIWGLGSFANVQNNQLLLFTALVFPALILSTLLMKPMNAMLLGDAYAQNLGVNLKQIRWQLILLSGFLTAIITAYTGPIAFIGLATPHLARLLFKSSDHKKLIPAVLLLGMLVALGCNLLARLPFFQDVLPINVITSLFGAPLVIYLIVKRKQIGF